VGGGWHGGIIGEDVVDGNVLRDQWLSFDDLAPLIAAAHHGL
jgi:hypothetical protein